MKHLLVDAEPPIKVLQEEASCVTRVYRLWNFKNHSQQLIKWTEK